MYAYDSPATYWQLFDAQLTEKSTTLHAAGWRAMKSLGLKGPETPSLAGGNELTRNRYTF
jgi:hypothetical protein